VWWAIFGATISWALTSLYHVVAAAGPISQIGAYGVAIVLLTIGIKVVLSPLYQMQLSMSKRAQADMRRVAPLVAELKKKYKGDPQRLQQEQLKLYKEHGVNPLGGLMGCLPALLQFPILTALYYVFLGNATGHVFPDHFLFVPHLNDSPGTHHLIAGLPIPRLDYLVFPLLAAATTFIQSKMMQQPPNPLATEQEQQQMQMQQTMQYMLPLMIGFFAIQVPAGLGLYWIISNCFAIIQQYLVNGWGGLRPPPPPGLTDRDSRKADPKPGPRGPRRSRSRTPPGIKGKADEVS
jgi:YidC/Oxa1 family membrane protein insertase